MYNRVSIFHRSMYLISLELFDISANILNIFSFWSSSLSISSTSSPKTFSGTIFPTRRCGFFLFRWVFRVHTVRYFNFSSLMKIRFVVDILIANFFHSWIFLGYSQRRTAFCNCKCSESLSKAKHWKAT